MKTYTSNESRAGEPRESRGPSSRGLRSLIANAMKESRGEEPRTEAVESSREIVLAIGRMEAQLQKLSESMRQGPQRVDTAMLAFLLDEFARMTDSLEAILKSQELANATASLPDQVRELRAITSRNAEVVKRMNARHSVPLLAMMLAGMLGGATVLVLERILR